nr:MAG TPA: holin [Caudoviricetes sp.]
MNKVKKFFQSIANAFKEVDWENVPKGTVVRYIMGAIAIINAILGSIGVGGLNISENTVYMIVTLIFSIAVIIMNTYKDNPTSKEGILAASIRNTLKEIDNLQEQKVIDELLKILETKDSDHIEDTPDPTEEEEESLQDEKEDDKELPDSDDPTDEA